MLDRRNIVAIIRVGGKEAGQWPAAGSRLEPADARR
jgi:hypothetical protein